MQQQSIHPPKSNVFRRLIYATTGLGYAEDHSAIDAILLNLRDIPDFKVKTSSRTALHASLAQILTEHIGAATASGAAAKSWEDGSRKFQAFIEIENSNKAIIEALPERRGIQANSFRTDGLNRMNAYLTKLSQSWQTFVECYRFCETHPSLPDAERIHFMHQFAKAALDRNWPGATELSGITALAARQALNNLPDTSIPRPINYGKEVLRGRPRYQPDLKWVLEDPARAAERYLDPMTAESDIRELGTREFARVAEKCVNQGKSPEDQRATFSDQITALSKCIICDRLGELPIERRAELHRFAQVLKARAAHLIASHQRDVSDVEGLDIASEDSIKAAVNAMQRIEQRCPHEFARLGVQFMARYVEFETAKNPQDALEVAKRPLTMEQVRILLPEVAEQKPTMLLRDYVRFVRQDLKENVHADLQVPLVRGGDRYRYLQPLSGDNAYIRMANELKARADYCPPGFSAEEFYAGEHGRFNKEVARRALDRWIEARVTKFEALQRALYHDIHKMLDSPKFITDERFQDTVGMMEQMRATFPEVYLHFANAFVYAWDQIPTMVMEKVMRPGEDGPVIHGSSERGKEAFRREMERSRGPTLSM